MNAIKRSFKLLGSKSPFEKDIIKLLCTPDQSAPTEKMLERKKRAVQPVVIENFSYSPHSQGSRFKSASKTQLEIVFR